MTDFEKQEIESWEIDQRKSKSWSDKNKPI